MRHFRSITVGELIDLLNECDKDAEIAFASDYGDHCHTKQVHSISGDFREETIHESAYSDSGWAIDDEPEEADDEAASRQRQILILK